MPKISLEMLRDGMVVASDIRNIDNMLLIPAGSVLTQRHINILNAWGITEIQVQSSDGSDECRDVLQQLPPETLAKITRELKALFWEPADKNPVQAEIFDLALRRKARQILGNKASQHVSDN